LSDNSVHADPENTRTSTRFQAGGLEIFFRSPYLFESVEIEELFMLLREWMLAQISFQNKDFDQLICDGKTLRGSAAQPDGADGAMRFVTQVTLYARELGVAIAQTSFDTSESNERAALKALLSTLELSSPTVRKVVRPV
jgi:hypothetical protein